MMRKRAILLTIVLITVFVFTGCSDRKNPIAISSPAEPSAAGIAKVPASSIPGFMYGFSSRDMENLYYWDSGTPLINRAKRAIDDVKKAGGKWWRPHIVWKFVEPNLLYPTLTKAQVTSSLVDTYISRTDWSFYDQLVSYANSQGVSLIFGICIGFINPFNQMPMYNGRPVTPRSDVSIGAEAYKANCYLHARACVRRYKASVKWWQCENEINTAGQQTIFPPTAPWRDGSEWWDGAFCQAVMTNIRDGVKIEDATATTTMNFNQLNKDAINSWSSLLDVVGYDYYPLTNVRTDNIYAELVDVQARAGAGKPILLCETGYDPGTGAITADKQRNFEDWMIRSYDAAVRAKYRGTVNLKGYLYFTGCTAETDNDGEHMGLVLNTNAYKWGFDLMQEFYGSSYTHSSKTFNEFESQNGYGAGTSTTVQIVGASLACEGNYAVKVVTSVSGDPGSTKQCVKVFRPDGTNMDITNCDRIGFSINDVTGSNTVKITVVDANGAVCSKWSDYNNTRNNKTVKNDWVVMSYPVANISGIDKTKVREIRIGFYWAGTYYVDQVMKIK